MLSVYLNRTRSPLAGLFIVLTLLTGYVGATELLQTDHIEAYFSTIQTTTDTVLTTIPHEVAAVSLGGVLAEAWRSLIATLASYGHIIAANWNRFLHGNSGVATTPGSTLTAPINKSSPTPISDALSGLSTTELKALVQAQVDAEVKAQLSTLKLQNQTSGANTGVVVVPSSGNASTDATLKAGLQNSFSDQVQVNFDNGGTSGVITPVFRSGYGSNYLFVLTPLRQ